MLQSDAKAFCWRTDLVRFRKVYAQLPITSLR